MALTQAVYRFGTNDGTETTHGWAGDQNAAITVGGAGIALDAPFLLRVGVQNNATAVSNINLTVQYKINAGSWVTITTSTAGVKAVAATPLTNNGNTTQRLTGLSGTFIGTNCQATDGDAGGNNLDFGNGYNAEALYGLQVNSAGVTAGDTITFQLLQEGAALAGYSVTPTLYVAKTLDPPAIASTVTMLAGVLAVGAVTLSMPAIASGVTLLPPTVSVAATQMTVVLSEGETARYTSAVTLTGSLATTELALSTEERDAITDWSNLRVSFIADGVQAEVVWAELETPEAAAAQTLEPPAISVGTTLLAPSLAVGAVTLQPPAIPAGTTLVAPTVAPGAVTLQPPAITTSATLYAGALTLNLSLPAIGAGTTLLPPVVTPGAVTLQPPLLSNISTLYAGAVTVGAVTLQPPTLASGSACYQPTVDQTGAPAQTLEPPPIAATTTLLPGAITTGAVTLGLPLLSNSSTLYAGAVTTGVVTLQPPTISAGSALLAPAVTVGAVTLDLPTIAATATLNAPTAEWLHALLLEGATVRASRTVPTTASLATAAFALTTDERVAITDWSALHLSLVASGKQYEVAWAELATPAAAAGDPQALDLPAISNASTLTEPALEQETMLLLPALSNSATLYAPSLVSTQMTVELREGDTVIASWSAGLPTAFGTLQLDLTTGQRDSITDWSALRVALIADGDRAQVSWLDFQIPAMAPLETAALSNVSTLYAPAIGYTTVTLELPPGIPSGHTLTPPSLTTGAVTLELPTLSNTSTLFPPTVVAAQALELPVHANTSDLFAGAITLPAVTLEPPAIDTTAQLFAPALAVGAVTLDGATIPSGSTTYPITVAAATVRLSGATIPDSTVLHPPTLTVSAWPMALPALTNAATLAPPSLAVGAVTLALPTLASTTVLLPPSTTREDELGGAHIGSTEATYAPTLTVGAVTLDLPAISTTTALYAPTLEQGALHLALPTIPSTTVLGPPRVSTLPLPLPCQTYRPLAEARVLRPREHRIVKPAAEIRRLGVTCANEPA